MNCVSCDICVYHLGLCVVFPGVFLSSRVTGACSVTTDLIMRVNVRTTTTTTPWHVVCPCAIADAVYTHLHDASSSSLTHDRGSIVLECFAQVLTPRHFPASTKHRAAIPTGRLKARR